MQVKSAHTAKSYPLASHNDCCQRENTVLIWVTSLFWQTFMLAYSSKRYCVTGVDKVKIFSSHIRNIQNDTWFTNIFSMSILFKTFESTLLSRYITV